MAEKLVVDRKDRKPEKAPEGAAEPARTLEEVYKPDAPVVQKLVLIDRSNALPAKKKVRTMSDIKI